MLSCSVLALAGDCLILIMRKNDMRVAVCRIELTSQALSLEACGKMEKTGQGRGKKKLSRGCTKMDRGKNRRRGGKNVLFESSVLLRGPLD